ncbi:MAG TPA: PepSY-like domain-containing protein [Vicinamibacterales bacterium]|nr:PepSY-like domain-containing protein [Vicinamibacterales bacterium]
MTRRILIALIAVAFVPGIAQAQTTPKPATPAKPAAAKPKVTLPPAIEAAFKAAYPSATINNVSKEKEAGQEIYEVESVDRGLHRDLNYKADGTVIDTEEEVAEADFPASVASAIKTRYPKATVVKREKLTKGATVTYEIQLKGGPGEVVLTPDGKWVSPKAKS